MSSISLPHHADGWSVIYADPPWSYADRGCNGAAEKQYSTMSAEEIFELPVGEVAAENCVLFLWATYPLLPQALKTIEAWGFKYKSIAFQWVKHYKGGKPFFGLGRWTRGNSEPCLLATRGKPKRANNSVSQLIITPDTAGVSQGELIVSPIGKHSKKPDEVRNRIVALMGDVPRLELFARQRSEGWESWGNEVDGPTATASDGDDILFGSGN